LSVYAFFCGVSERNLHVVCNLLGLQDEELQLRLIGPSCAEENLKTDYNLLQENKIMETNAKLRWKNYKSFADTGNLEIRPITILLGTNGSGKSSIIQPLLLLSQTLESADKSVPMMTRGEYVNAGTFKDIVHNHLEKNNVEFSFEFPINKVYEKKSNPKLGDIPPNKIVLKYAVGSEGMPQLVSFEALDRFDRSMLKRELQNDGYYSLEFFTDLSSDEEIYKLIKEHKPRRFIFDDSDIIKSHLRYNIKNNIKEGPQRIQFSKSVSLYLSIVSFTEKQLKTLFADMKYIGPIREHPQRFYEFSGEFHPEVGSRGQFTYTLLYQMLSNSKTSNQLNKWLQAFNLVKAVKCHRLESRPDLLEILVTPKDCNVQINFVDTCFGVSQILPLLVQCLMADDEDLIITEQPEIHLNPNCETTLADFFVEMVKTKKLNFIIETHSEHYLMRLRTHVKQGNIKNSDVAIYFTENTDTGKSIRLIELDEDGNFPNNDWPKNFFNQALTEGLMFATAKKRGVKKNGN